MIGNIVAAITSSGAPDVGDFESIETVTVGAGGASSVSFSSIPSTYQHLQIRGIVRSSVASGGDILFMRFNGVSSNGNYRAHQLVGFGTTVGAGVYGETDRIGAGDIAGNSQTANSFAGFVADILDYTNTNKNRVSRNLTGYDVNGGGVINFDSGLYLSTTALSSITIGAYFGNFVQHTQFALYGIRG